MTPAIILGWALVGWCGTGWRHWPPPPPPPDPWWWIVNVLGAVAGVAGGWAFSQMFNVDLASSAGVLLTFVGAAVGSVVANDVAGFVAPRGQAAG